MIRIVFTLFAASLLTPVVDQGQARFRSEADAVRVDVQARQGSRPITGLTAADFELRDSGVVQKIQAVATDDLPLTLMLALDTSSSVRGATLDHLKAAARGAVDALTGEDQAALLTFNNRVSRATPATKDRAQLADAIAGMTARGTTSLVDVVFAATALREDISGRVLLLVFTDGLDTISWLDPKDILDSALRSDLVAYTVSISPQLAEAARADAPSLARRRSVLKRWFRAEPALFPQAFIDELTEHTGGESFFVRDGSELAPTFAQIVSEFKSRYLLTYSPTGVPATGWHPIEVKLKNRRGRVQARRGYWR